MQDFWLRLFLYLLPFAVGFVTLTGGMIYIGESMPLSMVVAIQERDELVLFRYRYGNRDQQYKLLSANARRAPLLAVGSSRVLQFRDGFANLNPRDFYNASAPAWTLDEVEALLNSLDENALPQVLLLGLDLAWYSDNYEGDVFPEPISDFANIFAVNRSFLQDVLNGEDFDWGLYLARREPATNGNMALGMRAIRDGHGFRNDGSEQFGDYLVAEWLQQSQQREQHEALMRDCQFVYPCGDTVSSLRLEQTRRILAWADEREIYVVGFLPSYAPSLWAEMSNLEQHAYIHPAREALGAMFGESGFNFFDYSDGADLGLSDEDFFDGWHASEKGNLALYIQMVMFTPELQVFSDAVGLQAIFDASEDTWKVFKP